jgi:hypothetical protein
VDYLVGKGEIKMAVACQIMDGKWMMEEVAKEYQLPMELLREKRYSFYGYYENERVRIKLSHSDGACILEEDLVDRKGEFVTFNQLIKFMKDRMQLPDLFSLVVTVPYKGIVSCEVGIFPQKRVY